MKRSLIESSLAIPTSDGDGVKLNRVFGGADLQRYDPFLMMDDFGSDNADDYISGFPAHPHRGFRTITYMLEGHFEHRDNMGNVGGIKDGGVQWMTAGRGVIHSEMPKQTGGKLRGFQLWLNLPAKDKMMDPDYENIESEDIALTRIDDLVIKSVMGAGVINGQNVLSHKIIPDVESCYWDISNPEAELSTNLSASIPQGHNALVYVAQGQLTFEGRSYGAKTLLRFSDEGELDLEMAPESKIMLLSGKPLNEPIAQYGPFVMNSQEQIQEAIRDYQAGTLTQA
ncbi:pirin family protein [Alginatibacterium sediminis]|uniref:Pirin family protein n=1 Tax=Alginatibacterium sediminis TaxID=2164068 RepID=A0A420ENI5_9ALTE|nr:pirin family protein [Alginatibacterium sediminis]RKF22223.1 pirin family protein [Alginatibacterium sediminis]